MAPEELSDACREALRRQAQWYEAHIAELQLTVDEEREKYRRLRRAYNKAVGLGLSVEEQYERAQRHAEDLFLRLQFFQRMRATQGAYVVKLRPGRPSGASSYSSEYRRKKVEEFIRLRNRGLSAENAAQRVNHALKTLRNWARELGIYLS